MQIHPDTQGGSKFNRRRHRTFTNICLRLGVELWKTEMLTSHVPTTTVLLHYTDTADLRETCARDLQRVADWIEGQAKNAGHAA